MKRLDGKSALITGAARGIGRAFAEAHVAEGATVAISDIDVDGAEQGRVGAAVPIGRTATPADLTGMAVFLASAETDYIVAWTYNVDGGNRMS